MTGPWRKVENENGFPYYINDLTSAKQWDHPSFADIKQRLDECNYIKYSSYRLASKFRVLQCALYMEEVPLSTITGIFERHRLGVTEGTLCLESYDLEAVLSDIYFAANKQAHTNTDIDFATELMLNFLYNVYDKDRMGKIQVFSTKLILGLLSNKTSSELYNFIFNLCADHNNCITRLRLQTVLSKLTNLTEYIREDGCFGQQLINVSINECFSKSPGLVGITESTFMTWTEKSPEILAWVPILHRMKSSELVTHALKCSVCKSMPFMGLRYKCVKCSRYNQCQRCFLSGQTSQKHKVTHSMKEYCNDESSKEFKHILLKKICFLISCSNPHTGSIPHDVTIKSLKLLKTSTADVCSNIEPLSSPQSQLQVIIKQLELQNRELHQRLHAGSSEKDIKNYLEEHRLHVAAQIHKLKVLKDCMKSVQPHGTIGKRSHVVNHESTPMVPNGRTRGVALDLFSPIYRNINEEDNLSADNFSKSKEMSQDSTAVPYSLRDISTWIGASNVNFAKPKSVRETHSDLDEALAKLQQILANNFTLDESLGSIDNGQLKCAVTEVEGMLTSLIDTVEIGSALHNVKTSD